MRVTKGCKRQDYYLQRAHSRWVFFFQDIILCKLANSSNHLTFVLYNVVIINGDCFVIFFLFNKFNCSDVTVYLVLLY